MMTKMLRAFLFAVICTVPTVAFILVMIAMIQEAFL